MGMRVRVVEPVVWSRVLGGVRQPRRLPEDPLLIGDFERELVSPLTIAPRPTDARGQIEDQQGRAFAGRDYQTRLDALIVAAIDVRRAFAGRENRRGFPR